MSHFQNVRVMRRLGKGEAHSIKIVMLFLHKNFPMAHAPSKRNLRME